MPFLGGGGGQKSYTYKNTKDILDKSHSALAEVQLKTLGYCYSKKYPS